MRDVVKAALDVGFSHIHIMGDKQLAIQAVQSSTRTLLRIQVLPLDIRSTL